MKKPQRRIHFTMDTAAYKAFTSSIDDKRSLLKKIEVNVTDLAKEEDMEDEAIWGPQYSPSPHRRISSTPASNSLPRTLGQHPSRLPP